MKTNLKEIRKARGFKSAKAFAESIGMQEKTYRNYEQGARNLYLDVACELCSALGCSLDELVGNPPRHESRVMPLERDEENLIDLYRRMEDSDKGNFMNIACTLALAGEIKNKDHFGDVHLVGDDVK